MKSQPRGDGGRLRPSSARKVEAILDAAESVFLETGYAAASMDEVSARARVSKQTVYTHFQAKEPLFIAVVTRITAAASAAVHYDTADPRDLSSLEEYLERYARRQLDVVLHPRVLAVRRLVIAEAPRFPHLARAFWDAGPATAMSEMATRFARFTAAGLLTVTEPDAAARAFNWLAMGEALNAAMMLGADAAPDADERARTAAEAARVFLAAYRA
jgi:TetR/AcrR family transcriptional regulator, mexJK operon transcriptional repressor